MVGTVIRVLINKGYGFVRDEEGFSRLIHVNEFVNRMEFETLREGQAVEFEPVDNGPRTSSSNSLRGKQVRVVS